MRKPVRLTSYKIFAALLVMFSGMSTASWAQTSIAINAGGTAAGSFVADADFSGGATINHANTVDLSGAANPAPMAVYQAARVTATAGAGTTFSYTIPGFTAGSSHTVRLHFAETFWTATGQRIFNVSSNGTQVLTNFDIFATAGAMNKAVIEQFTATANASGQINLVFTTVTDKALISGIEIAGSAPPPPTTIQINAGGPAVSPFIADVDSSGGATINHANTIDLSGVTNPAPMAVYQTARVTATTGAGTTISYTIPGFTAGSSHTVRLHFAETFWTAAGQRVFNVSINGTQVLSNFDIFATAGAMNKAVVEQFTATANVSGQIDIIFTTVTDKALISGIEVLGSSGGPPPPPATGLAISPFLQGANDWSPTLPDSVWPIVGRSGAKIVRIGGIQQDNTPLDNSTLLHQVDQIRSAGAEPLIQVSRFQSAQAAAAMVNFINVQNGRNVKFWSIGNEPDLHFSGTDDQLAAQVAGYIKSIAPAMRDVDASIHIIAPSMAFWTQTKYFDLLGGADDITGTDSKGRFFVDGIDLHRYGFGSSITFANQLHNRSGSHALTWSLTEFNISFANPSPNDISGLGTCSFLNGQYFAEYFKTGMADSFHDIDTWSIYQDGGSCDGGDLGYLGGGTMIPRSSYYHFQMISQFLLPGGAGYLAATSSNGLVSPLSTINSTNVAVMILNEDTVDHTFSVRLDSNAVQGPGDTKINVPANVPQEHADSIPNQSTMVLVFDFSGTLKTKVTYSLTNNQNGQAPFVQNF